jgi:sodium/bile acid cotransporter 7
MLRYGEPMVPASLRRSLSAIGQSVLALLLGGACPNPGDLPVAEKQQRIDELFEGYRKKFPDAPEMTVETLKARLAAPHPPVIVDTRGDDERAVSMIPGALSQEEFEERREELAGREVVTYCTIGYRSGLYTEKLVEEGWTAFNLRGSIVSWTHVGGALVEDGAPTKRVHVYGRKWNLLADGYEAVW